MFNNILKSCPNLSPDFHPQSCSLTTLDMAAPSFGQFPWSCPYSLLSLALTSPLSAYPFIPPLPSNYYVNPLHYHLRPNYQYFPPPNWSSCLLLITATKMIPCRCVSSCCSHTQNPHHIVKKQNSTKSTWRSNWLLSIHKLSNIPSRSRREF